MRNPFKKKAVKEAVKPRYVLVELQGNYYTLTPGDTLDVTVTINMEGDANGSLVTKPIGVRIVSVS